MPSMPVRPDPYSPQPPPTGSPVTLQSITGGARTVTATNATPLMSIIFGAVGIFFFPPLGIVAIIMAAITLRRPTSTKAERTMAIVGLLAGIVALVAGAAQLLFIVISFTGLPS
jgi:hypothetical protein